MISCIFQKKNKHAYRLHTQHTSPTTVCNQDKNNTKFIKIIVNMEYNARDYMSFNQFFETF